MKFKIERQGHNFVINNGAKTVAYLYFKYARDESKYRNVELSYLHVSPSYIRRGIGTLGFKQIALQRDYHEKGIGTRLFVKRLNKG